MNPTLLPLMIFLGVTLLVVSCVLLLNDVFFRYRLQVNQRLDDLAGHSKEEGNATLLDLKLLAAQTTVSKDSWAARLNNRLAQAGLTVSARTIVYVAMCCATILGLATGGITRHWWTVPIGVFVGSAIPLIYVNSCYGRRVRKISQQLPDALDAMARAVRAGQTVPAAIQLIADEFPAPLSDEFWHCFEQQQLGVSYELALRDMSRRSCVMEIRILVVALLVQSRSGGNLVELLTSLSRMARKRIKMKKHIRALTGEGRMQAVVLIVLPIAAFIALLVLAPDYAKELIKRPWLLGGTVLFQTIGALWIRKIIQIDV